MEATPGTVGAGILNGVRNGEGVVIRARSISIAFEQASVKRHYTWQARALRDWDNCRYYVRFICKAEWPSVCNQEQSVGPEIAWFTRLWRFPFWSSIWCPARKGYGFLEMAFDRYCYIACIWWVATGGVPGGFESRRGGQQAWSKKQQRVSLPFHHNHAMSVLQRNSSSELMLVHDQPPRHTLQSSTPSRTVSLASIGINTLSLSRQETLSQLPTLRRTASTESFESVATTIPDSPILSPQSFALLQGLKIRDFAYDKDDHRFAHLAVPTKSTNSDDGQYF